MARATPPAAGGSFEAVYDRDFTADLKSWVRDDSRVAEKILQLVANPLATPFAGLGKPEPLPHERRGYRSRRITQEHRLVYRVSGRTICFIQCRYHY